MPPQFTLRHVSVPPLYRTPCKTMRRILSYASQRCEAGYLTINHFQEYHVLASAHTNFSANTTTKRIDPPHRSFGGLTAVPQLREMRLQQDIAYTLAATLSPGSPSASRAPHLCVGACLLESVKSQKSCIAKS